jgi:putative ABC transport system permease protein
LKRHNNNDVDRNPSVFFTYLSRELAKRRKQTLLISSGLAVAIALVMVVAGMASGIRSAQSEALSGLYGIGTDITVTKAETFIPGQFGGQRFAFGANGGTTSGKTQTFNRSRLEVQRGSATLTAAEVAKVNATSGVSAAVATLKLNDTTFNGTLPTFSQNSAPGSTTGNAGGFGGGMAGGATSGGFSGGADGRGGSSFNISSFSVEGISAGTTKVGPMAGTKLTSGRYLSTSDASASVAVVDANYAKTNSLKVGSVVSMSTRDFRVVGIVESTSSAATTPSNVYIPITVAQEISGNSGAYTTVYVKAENSSLISGLKTSLSAALPKATVSTESDLASNVSGSLSTAANMVDQMGGWLAAFVLLAAFATSILFTTSGVNRRTREFGTLKAIGWRSRRIVGQVMGESLVTGLIGGVFGLVLGGGIIAAINAYGPTVSASVSRAGLFGGQGGPFGGGMAGGFGGSSTTGTGSGFGGGFRRMFGQQAQNTMNLALHANIELWMILAAIGFALIGGLLAGAFGGLRAAKLSPADALRSIA